MKKRGGVLYELADYAKYMADYKAKKSDTANYWVKNVSVPGSGIYSTVLLPARDTVKCYFLVDYNAGTTNLPETIWYYGYAIRWHEQVVGFLLNKYRKEPTKYPVIYYKIVH